MKWKNNERMVHSYEDGSYYTYSDGNKDSWHLLFYDVENNECELYDKDYLKQIAELPVLENVSKDTVYRDFNVVCDLVQANGDKGQGDPLPNEADFVEIREIATKYKDTLKVDKLLGFFYLSMISEWYYINRHGTRSILKHRVKKLGVYQVLFLDMRPDDAANYSKNKSVSQLKTIMQRYGV